MIGDVFGVVKGVFFHEYVVGRRRGDSRLRGNDVMGVGMTIEDSRMTARRRWDVGAESYQGGLNGLAGIGVGEGG